PYKRRCKPCQQAGVVAAATDGKRRAGRGTWVAAPGGARRRYLRRPSTTGGRSMTHQYGSSDGQGWPGRQPAPAAADGDDLKARAQAVGEQARGQVEARLDQQRRGAAERLDRLASSVRAAAGELEQQDDAELSQYVARFAGTLGGLADSLRTRNVDELLQDLRGAARRNPGLFLAGSVAVGFGLARFARASARHPQAAPVGADAGADAMAAWALDGGSSGGYRGSLSSHGTVGNGIGMA